MRSISALGILLSIITASSCYHESSTASSAPPLPAGTRIAPGAVSGVWREAGSPYRILGDIYITRGSTLRIEPGVTVLFTGNYKLDNFGQISAVGTATKRILFTAENTALIASLNYGDPVGSGGWGGIRMQDPELPATTFSANPDTAMRPSSVNPEDANGYCYDPYLPQIFRFCDFEYANKLVEIDPNNGYYANRGGALFFWYAYDITVDNCRFYRCQARGGGALYYVVLAAAPDRMIQLTNCEFRECKALGPQNDAEGGALLAHHGYIHIERVTFTDCHTDGVGGGCYFFDSFVWMKNVSFSGNTADHPYTTDMGQANYFFGMQPSDADGKLTVL
jgi:hypothetical protein